METDFIYCRHKTPPGIKVEEVYGAEDRSGAVWFAMARQIYMENGRYDYRAIDHTDTGAPILLQAEEQRISVSHTKGLFVVATLPPVEGVDLTKFSPAAALGIDAERADRRQVLKVRSKFLNTREEALIPAESIELNILAWTVKEAVFKACLHPGLDLRDINITKLPDIEKDTETAPKEYGNATVSLPDGTTLRFYLYSFRSQSCIVTLAWMEQTRTFKK